MSFLLNTPLNPLRKEIKLYFKRKKGAAVYKNSEMHNPGDYKSMNCFYYYKCIFIHIPKTAGKSISKTLFGNFSGLHTPVEKFDWYFGKRTFNRYFKFTFVRNPWDRIFSAYNYYKKGNEEFNVNKTWIVEHEFWQIHLSEIRSFEDFVLNWLNEERLQCNLHFSPQYLMLTLPEDRNKILVDFIGRYENIETDFKIVCNKLNLRSMPLQKINVSNFEKDSYKKIYTKEMIEKVAGLYAKDIQLLSYSFS